MTWRATRHAATCKNPAKPAGPAKKCSATYKMHGGGKSRMRRFYAATKEIYGPTRSSVNHLKDVDGTTVLSEPDRILEHWKNHFKMLFNNQSTTPADLLRNSPTAPTQHWMSEPPTPDELTKAMKRVKLGKAPGPDNVPFELLNSAGPALKSRLMELLTRIWNSDFVPPEFKNANIVTIFKKVTVCPVATIAEYHFSASPVKSLLESCSTDFSNWRRKSYQSPSVELDLPAANRHDLLRKTTARKSREQQQPLMQIFWDLRKAFDKVPRPAMWLTLAKFGCPDRFINLIRALHDGMTARV